MFLPIGLSFLPLLNFFHAFLQRSILGLCIKTALNVPTEAIIMMLTGRKQPMYMFKPDLCFQFKSVD